MSIITRGLHAPRLVPDGECDGQCQPQIDEAVKWYLEEAISVEDALEWLWNIPGITRDEANAWRRTDLGVDAAAAWRGRGFHPDNTCLWRSHSFSPGVAREWRDAGFGVVAATRWVRAKVPIQFVESWVQAGFDAVAAADWISAGVTDPGEARMWAEAFQGENPGWWRTVFVDPNEAAAWSAHFTVEQASAWGQGIGVDEALHWSRVLTGKDGAEIAHQWRFSCVTDPDVARQWTDVGVTDPVRAACFTRGGYSPERIAAHRAGGAATVPVWCGASWHDVNVEWSCPTRGLLRVAFHSPDHDVHAEDIGVGFGGRRPRCLSVVDVAKTLVDDTTDPHDALMWASAGVTADATRQWPRRTHLTFSDMAAATSTEDFVGVVAGSWGYSLEDVLVGSDPSTSWARKHAAWLLVFTGMMTAHEVDRFFDRHAGWCRKAIRGLDSGLLAGREQSVNALASAMSALTEAGYPCYPTRPALGDLGDC